MSEKAQNDKEWKSKQLMKEGLSINRLLDKDFLDNFDKIFNEKNVDAIQLAIVISDKIEKGNDDKKPIPAELVSLNHLSANDTENKILTLELSNPDSFDKISNILDKYMG
jgi:hypothetical protein